jgi:spermidine synthase
LLAAAGAFGLDRRGASAEGSAAALERPRASRGRTRPDAAPGSAGALLALAAFSGAGTFAAQVLLVEAFAQVLNQSAYAFGAVLVTVLVTLGAGSALVAALARRGIQDLRSVLAFALAGAALGLVAFPPLLSFWTDGFAFVGAQSAWPAYLLVAQGIAFAGAGPALLAAALVFPLCFALAGNEAGDADTPAGGAGALLGRLAAANTLGAIAGALVAPWVLLPALGLWPAFVALAAAYAGAALWLRGVSPQARLGTKVLLAAGALAVLGLANPLRLPPVRLEPGEALVFAETGAAGVVSVIERHDGRLVRTDNHYNLGGSADRVHQERQGHLPLLLHPGARSVVHLGAATGISAGASLAHPVERLFVVELVPGVARAGLRFFADANRGVYTDPRTRLVVDDARNFLRHTRERFDVVVADLFVPWRSGAAALYAREHFAAVRERLQPGGLFCQWLPLYQLTRREFELLAATFVDVFPHAALWRGDFFGAFPIAALVGWHDAPAHPAEVAAAARALGARGEADRWVADPTGVWALYVGPLGPLAEALADAPRNTDDRPRIEFLAARSHAGGRRGKEEPFTGLPWAHFAALLREAAAREGDPLYGPLPDFARRATDAGAALQAAGAYWVAGRRDEASRALTAAAELLPAHLLAEAPADPTAAELWFDTGGARPEPVAPPPASAR